MDINPVYKNQCPKLRHVYVPGEGAQVAGIPMRMPAALWQAMCATRGPPHAHMNIDPNLVIQRSFGSGTPGYLALVHLFPYFLEKLICFLTFFKVIDFMHFWPNQTTLPFNLDLQVNIWKPPSCPDVLFSPGGEPGRTSDLSGLLCLRNLSILSYNL